MSLQTPAQTNPGLAAWAENIAQLAVQSKNLTLGLISGNRFGNDHRVVFSIVRELQESLASRCSASNILLCRLDVQSPSSFNLLMSEADELPEPKVEKSALGKWSYVEVPMTVGSSAPSALKLVPRLLPKWKLHYKLVLIDLGPLHEVPSRIVGRLCDCNYIILGPGSCASAQWITQHVTFHEDCGSQIGGTICATSAA